MLQQTVSNQAYCSYKFPPNFVLRGGAMVTVRTLQCCVDSNTELVTIQYTLYSIHYTVYTIQYTLYSIHYTVYSILYMQYRVHCTVYSVNCMLCTLQCTATLCLLYSNLV